MFKKLYTSNFNVTWINNFGKSTFIAATMRMIHLYILFLFCLLYEYSLIASILSEFVYYILGSHN